MFEREKLGIWTRVFLSFVLLAVLIGGGYAVYRMGFTQGAIATEAGDLTLSNWFDRPLTGHSHHYPYGFGFFSIWRFFFGFFFLMMVFGLFRRIIFGPRWARWGYGWGPHPGKWGSGYGPRSGRRGYRFGPRGYCGHPNHPWYPWSSEEDTEKDPETESEEDKPE